jgi:hypothetical protein
MAPEQPEREHRLRGPALVHDEQREQHDAAQARAPHLRAAPPDGGLADEREHGSGEPEGGERRAQPVDACVVRAALARRHGRLDQRQRDEHERHVDAEDQPP